MPVIVEAAHVLALSRFTSKNRNDCLSCISIEPATPLPGACLVAMTGRVAGIIYDAGATIDKAVTFNPSAELLKECRKVKNGGTVHIDGALASVRTEPNNLVIFVQSEPATVDEQYPNWRSFMRHEIDPAVPLNEIPINLKELALFELGGAGALRLHAYTASGPVYVRLQHWPNFVGAIMPIPATDMSACGEDLTTSGKPSWLSLLTRT